MDNESCQLGDQITSDTIVHLQNQCGKPELFHCHSSILAQKSMFFASKLSVTQSSKSIDISCPDLDYDLYVKLLNLLYLPEDSILESFDSVKSTLGILRISICLQCESITVKCIEYLEAMPWEEKEEEEVLHIAQILGPLASPLLARLQPSNQNSTKKVFISAIRFATSIDESFPPFNDELKTSAQEQVEYMLAEDEDTPLIAVDEKVKLEAKAGLEKILSTFNVHLNSLTLDCDHSILQSISDLDWICNVLSKMELMKEFVTAWAEISDHVIEILQDDKFSCGLWAVKYRVIELVGKAFDAIGFGNVVLPTLSRVRFLKTWLPFLRKMKPLLDSKYEENETFPYKMDADLCQNIEGAIVSLILALPSSDQAEILNEWMKLNKEIKFPDLCEAFEVWCYRAKAAKRRLVDYSLGGSNPTVSL